MNRKEEATTGEEAKFSPLLSEECVASIASYRKDLKSLKETTGGMRAEEKEEERKAAAEKKKKEQAERLAAKKAAEAARRAGTN